MSDMRPRRMDGARPAGPSAGSQQRPAPAPPRPVPQPRVGSARVQAYREQQAREQHARDPYAREYAPPSRQQYAASGRMVGQPGRQQPYPQPQQEAEPKQTRKRGGAWKVAAQFVVGLLVIALVAGAIVWLYVRYYQ